LWYRTPTFSCVAVCHQESLRFNALVVVRARRCSEHLVASSRPRRRRRRSVACTAEEKFGKHTVD
jgi:hypothetical protein